MRARLDYLLAGSAPQVAEAVNSDGALGGVVSKERVACWLALYIAVEEERFLQSRGYRIIITKTTIPLRRRRIETS